MIDLHVRTVWHTNIKENTYGEHQDVLADNNFVYWGVIHDKEYPEAHRYELDPYLNELNKQISIGKSKHLFIETCDPLKEYFWGKISGDIKKGIDFVHWKISNYIPTYYKTCVSNRPDLVIDYWIPLSDLRKIPHEIFMKARPVKYGKYETKKYGKYGRPYPVVCVFEAEDELVKYFKLQNAQSVPVIDNSFNHSPDFRSITINGVQYSITAKQAQVVEVLYKAWQKGTPELSEEYILEEAGLFKSKSIKDIFRSRKEDMKHICIRGKSPGTYRLNI